MGSQAVRSMPASSISETERFASDNSERYRELKDEWWGVPDVFERQDVIEVRQQVTPPLAFINSHASCCRSAIASMWIVAEPTGHSRCSLKPHL